MIKSKFDFYDIVKIVSNKKSLSEVNGKRGIITGKAQDEEDPSIFSYGVTILDDQGEVGDGWFIFEEDLQATGERTDRSKIYTGESIRVRVDPETGEGYLVDEEEE